MIFLEVFLNGKDPGLLHSGTSPNRPGFVTEQVLCFLGIFGTLSHRIRVLLQHFGPDFGRKELGHESHANLVEQGFMDSFLSLVTLRGRVLTIRRSIRWRQDLADNLESVDDVGVEFVQVLERVGSLPDIEHGVDEGSGAVDVPKVGQHLLLEVGPCLTMVHFVVDGPVGHGSLGDT